MPGEWSRVCRKSVSLSGVLFLLSPGGGRAPGPRPLSQGSATLLAPTNFVGVMVQVPSVRGGDRRRHAQWIIGAAVACFCRDCWTSGSRVPSQGILINVVTLSFRK